jgi:hypothetical protein
MKQQLLHCCQRDLMKPQLLHCCQKEHKKLQMCQHQRVRGALTIITAVNKELVGGGVRECCLRVNLLLFDYSTQAKCTAFSTENKRATAVITRRRMIMEAKEYDVVITKLTNYTLVVSQALELRGSFVVVCVVIL